MTARHASPSFHSFETMHVHPLAHLPDDTASGTHRLRWALSPSDWLAHAVVGDAMNDRHFGGWTAGCGKMINWVTPLFDVPQGPVCAACAPVVRR